MGPDESTSLIWMQLSGMGARGGGGGAGGNGGGFGADGGGDGDGGEAEAEGGSDEAVCDRKQEEHTQPTSERAGIAQQKKALGDRGLALAVAWAGAEGVRALRAP